MQATVIDGDGEHVRLQSIDAPELRQTCTAYGQEWACGRTAGDWLRTFLAGRTVECVGHARDRYGRLLAVCYLGGEELNERIVREGWALDYRKYSTDGGMSGQTRRRRHVVGEFGPRWKRAPGAPGERSGNEGCCPRDYGV